MKPFNSIMLIDWMQLKILCTLWSVKIGWLKRLNKNSRLKILSDWQDIVFDALRQKRVAEGQREHELGRNE